MLSLINIILGVKTRKFASIIIGERAKHYQGNTIENRGYWFILNVWMYVNHFCTLTLAFLC